MKYAIKIFALVAITFLAIQCNTAEQDNNSITETPASHENPAIQLNNGEKWLVNEAMKPFIQAEEANLNEFIATNSVDYKTLAAQLKEKNTGLIQSCTMQGESHDELHKWLHPHMELIKTLAVAADTAEAQKIIEQLQNSYKTYNQYFQ